MNKNRKSLDRIYLVLAAIIVAIIYFLLIVKLDKSGIDKGWQSFWGAGLISYIVSTFVLRESVLYRRNISIFKTKSLHYLFVMISYLLPVVAIVTFFKIREKNLPIGIYAHGFGGCCLAVATTVFVEKLINKKHALYKNFKRTADTEAFPE